MNNACRNAVDSVDLCAEALWRSRPTMAPLESALQNMKFGVRFSLVLRPASCRFFFHEIPRETG